MAAIAPLENFQLDSSLMGLPAEIKHIIYGLCFAAPLPIADPVVSCEQNDSNTAATGGVALIQTCRRLYLEADRRPLFAQNTFRFTTVGNARTFLQSIDRYYCSSIHDIEVDVRKVTSDSPDIAREWLQYLSPEGASSNKSLSTLSMDAPGLNTLRLNFESWPKVSMFRSDLWRLLKSMLSEVRGLNRVVVIGASKGAGMARRDPWSPAHFVGADDVGFGELIPRMWACVGGADSSKVIRWTRENGRLNLEVVSKTHLVKQLDASWRRPTHRQACREPWPVNGSCTLDGYLDRDLECMDTMTKGLNPIAVG